MKPEIVLNDLRFPECPRWHDGALYFSDMHDGVVWRLTPAGASTRVVEVPALPAGLGWLPDGTLLVVSMIDRRLLRCTPQGVETVADLSAHATGVLNDMVVASSGRAYIGNFGFDLIGGETSRPTVLVSVDRDGSVRAVAGDLLFPNAAVITPDGKKLILAETLGSRLTAFDITPDGALTNRRVFAELTGLMPDGICLDAEGALWVGCPSGNTIVRVQEGGRITHDIPLPGRDSYGCMLGGDDRRDLYICTAQSFLPEQTETARVGKIEMVRVEVPGTGLP